MRSFSTRAAGLLILILGVWGGLIPFVGPYFHFVLGPTKSWTWSADRFYLDVLPGIVAVVGGLLLIGAGPRAGGRLGALLALAAGIWFAIGPLISELWKAGGAQGAAHGSRDIRMLEMLTYHTGLGVVMAALAGYALPRAPRTREVVAAPGAAAAPEAAEDDRRPVAAEEPAYAGEPATMRGEPVAAGAPAAARTSEYAGEGPVGDRDRGYADEPPTAVAGRESGGDANAADGGETPAATGPPPDNRAHHSEHSEGTTADEQSASGPPVADSGGTYENDRRTVRRRRGGLLSPLLRR
jgi:hypothetical protein